MSSVAAPVCESCGRPAETVDLANGRRCGQCRPVYRPLFAGAMAAAGFPGAAAAHLRTHVFLTQQRLAERRTINKSDRASSLTSRPALD